MSKRRQAQRPSRRTRQPSGLDVATWRRRIESLLTQDKSREAVEAAKQCLKECPGVEAEELAIQAYTARILSLQAHGMHQEAQALGSIVRERFPAYQSQFALLLQPSGLATGDVEALLTELATAEPARQRELERRLASTLTDPAMVAHTAVLPDAHPLKGMARAVSEMFTAVTSGPLPAGALVALDAIPRQSLFAPWKLLIRALDAFYRHDDAAVLANLERIPAETVPARLAPALRRLMPPDDSPAVPVPAVAALIEQVGGPRSLVRTQLAQLTQALTARDGRKALAAVRSMLPSFQSAPAALRRTFLASLFHLWYRYNLSPEQLLKLLPSGHSDPDILRLIALTLEHLEWALALQAWDRYLTSATATGQLASTGPEIARVLLHMAQLFPPDREAVLDTLELDSEQQLHRQIRSGRLPACFDRPALLERARAADPVAQVFRALVAHYEQWGDPKRAEAEAEAWHRAHPQDLEPVLYVLRATERRGAIRKALNCLAEAIDRVHPEVRQSRFRLLLAGAERRIKEGKLALALDDLRRLEQETRASEGDYPAYLLALRWLAALPGSDMAVPQAEAFANGVANPVLQSLILEALGATLKVAIPPLPKANPSHEQVLDGLARACTLFRALDRPLPVPAALLKRAEQHLEQASTAQLHALCTGGLWLERPALTYHAAGHGLGRTDPLGYRFLLARGQALAACQAYEAQDRARSCLRAARELASRARDMEAVRDASTALDTFEGLDMFRAMFGRPLEPDTEASMSQEEIAQIIAQERSRRGTPQFPATAARRKTRRTARRRPGFGLPDELFEDLFSFMPFERPF